MQISRKQLNIFNRINKKLRTIPIYFIANYHYLLRKYCYLEKPHYIIKCRLKKRKEKTRKVIILFNQLKKLGAKRKSQVVRGKQRSSKIPLKKFNEKIHPDKDRKKKQLKQKSKSKAITKVSTGQPKSEHQLSPNDNKSKVSINPNSNSDTKLLSLSNDITKEPADKIGNTKGNHKELSKNDDGKKETSTTAESVNEQIREQLKLLQSGRRSSISLCLNNGKNISPQSGRISTSSGGTPSFSRHASHSSLENEVTKKADDKSTKAKSTQKQSNQKPGFIDSLINKLKTQGLNLETSVNEDSLSVSASSSPEKSSTIHSKTADEIEMSHEDFTPDFINDDDQMSDHSTSSKNGFLGFREAETQFERPNIPGMLPTPIVENSKGVKSAFVSEELDNFMKENALDNESYKTAPLKKRHDEAMMYAEAEPPSLLCPQLPSDVEKPRTVAEKRQLLERKANIKYLMIENESTVYRELRKRSKTGPVPNYTLIRNIQQMDIPFTRDCWRATCWLNTPNGKFYFQTINDCGEDIKVLGGKGNNTVKELCKLPPKKKKKLIRQDCTKACKLVGNIKVHGLDQLMLTEPHRSNSESIFTSKKLNTLSDGYSFQKPGPLSLKKLNPLKSSIDVELGPLELYSLPRIQLQVWPKIDRPLPDIVHPYLKLALPYQKITPEWAEYALSTLKPICITTRRKRKRTAEVKELNKSFTFNIPYTNNQNRILVRKRRKIDTPLMAPRSSIIENEEAELSFMKDVDRSNDVAVDVADVLTGMINSVALTLCEASVIKDDPDIDYAKVDGQIENTGTKLVGMNVVDGKKKNTPTGKVVKELKKLNAKIIHGFDTIKREECNNDFCKLGCICESLRGSQTYSYHCKEVNCMFECKCPSSKINTSTFESAVHNSDIKQYCDRMNASLAKEEKDFTATVVVSDGKTIYVPTWDVKKKRNKKVPKRLSDCVQFESEFVHRDLTETFKTKEEKRMREKMEIVDHVTETVVTNQNDILKNMIHVNVNVERLSVLDKLQPWCMIHCLYKCFCRFSAVEGERFEFGNTKIDIIEPIYTKKRQYTFERNKDEPTAKIMKISKVTSTSPYYVNTDDLCRRVCVVATTQYKIINAARSVEVRKRIKRIEQDHPGLKILLRNRVKRSTLMTEVGPLVPVVDSQRVLNNSVSSTENRSFTGENRSSTGENRSFTGENRSFTGENRSFTGDNRSSTGENRSSTGENRSSTGENRSSTVDNRSFTGDNRSFTGEKLSITGANRSFNVDIQSPTTSLNNQTEKQFVKEAIPTTSNKPVEDSVEPARYRLRFNKIIMKTMQGISQRLKQKTDLPSPVNKALNCIQWKHFLDAYNADQIYIWEVQLNTHEVLLVVTDKNIMPIVSNAIYVINIRAVSTERLPVLPKLIKLGIINEQTEKMSILLFGISNYWRVLGCTHSENDFLNKCVVAIPTPDTNPRLASKISNLFDDMVQLKSKKPEQPKKYPLPTIPKSNICIRSLDEIDVSKIHLPIPVIGCHRWLMLSLANDFSHIFVPPWKHFLTYDTIQNAIAHAKKTQKTVRMGPTNTTPYVYVPHNSEMKIFFGPMKKNETLSLQLLQNFDGKMLPREDYQRVAKPIRNGVTIGTWLYMKDDQIVVEKNSKIDESNHSQPKRPEIPKLNFFTKASSELPRFIPLSPSTNSGNHNITLVSSASSSSTSTPEAVPSSEMIRHLSLGLRQRPAKVSTIISTVTPSSTIAYSTESHPSTSSASMRTPIISRKDVKTGLSQPINSLNNHLSPPNTQTSTFLIPASVSFSRCTSTVTSSQIKNITASLASTTSDSSTTTGHLFSKDLPAKPQIRGRRYTTFIPSGSRPSSKLSLLKATGIKNFELLQSAGNTLTLAPLSAESSSKLNDRPTNKATESVKSMPSLLRQRSKTVDRPRPVQFICKPLSPTFAINLHKQGSVNPLNSTITSKPSIRPVPMMKPITLKLNPPPVVISAANVSAAKRPSSSIISIIKPKLTASVNALTSSEVKPVIKNIMRIPATLRHMPHNFKSVIKSSSRALPSGGSNITEIINCDDDDESIMVHPPSNIRQTLNSDIEYPLNGFVVSEIPCLGKIMAKKLREGYTIILPPFETSKYFLNLRQCIEYLNNVYIKDRIFQMVPANFTINWKFVHRDEDHDNFILHTDRILKSSMVLTKTELIDLHSDFDLNESYSMDLRHHLLVLKLAHACMENKEARVKTGLQIVKTSEEFIKKLLVESKELENEKISLQIEKHLNSLKLSALRKENKTNLKTSDIVPLQNPSRVDKEEEIITIDSDDD